jgi:hypothetical protein
MKEGEATQMAILRRARAALSVFGQGRVEKAKPPLDALDPTVGSVDLVLDTHEIFPHRGEVYPDSGDLLFDRGDSALQIAHLFARLFDHRTNYPQVLQDQVVRFVSHGLGG